MFLFINLNMPMVSPGRFSEPSEGSKKTSRTDEAVIKD
uniref:Uncharacterized protein n=1 Tax=Arundo donax TaxID=35708 RepID=A0A0A9FVA2_ARUDO